MSNTFAGMAGGPPRGSYIKIARTFRATTFDVARYIHNPDNPGRFQIKWCGTYHRYGEALLAAQVWQAQGYYLKDDVGEAGARQ